MENLLRGALKNSEAEMTTQSDMLSKSEATFASEGAEMEDAEAKAELEQATQLVAEGVSQARNKLDLAREGLMAAEMEMQAYPRASAQEAAMANNEAEAQLESNAVFQEEAMMSNNAEMQAAQSSSGWKSILEAFANRGLGLQDTFMQFDEDQTGKISFKNLKQWGQAVSFDMVNSDVALQTLIDEADTDGDGEISMEEFSQVWANAGMPIGGAQAEMQAQSAGGWKSVLDTFGSRGLGMEATFQQLDDDHTGKISFKNLKKVSQDLSLGKSYEDLQMFIDEGDKDGDGEINMGEFTQVWANAGVSVIEAKAAASLNKNAKPKPKATMQKKQGE
jgi:Ca2+-binding EF-hand superfamily protein